MKSTNKRAHRKLISFNNHRDLCRSVDCECIVPSSLCVHIHSCCNDWQRPLWESKYLFQCYFIYAFHPETSLFCSVRVSPFIHVFVKSSTYIQFTLVSIHLQHGTVTLEADEAVTMLVHNLSAYSIKNFCNWNDVTSKTLTYFSW